MDRKQLRVIALGGCGGMGRFAVRTALNYDFIKEIVIADRNADMARGFAQACGPKASYREIDVMDREALSGLLREADVIMTTVGPYYRLGMPVLRAAIEAGCHYLDINDDWEPTLEMLSLDGEARQAGVTAIIGMGASPGISNMLAAKALGLLDSVEDLYTGWGVSGEDGETDRPGEGGSYGAAIEHWLHQITGTIRVLQQGRFVDAKPIQEVKIDYPGLGSGLAYTVGHPEPVTLPRLRPELKNSSNVMVISPRLVELLRGLAAEIDGGRLSISDGVQLILGHLASPDEEPSSPPPDPGSEIILPPLFAYARGMKDGKRTSVAVTITAGIQGGMGGATGVPLAIGLKMLATGKIARHGVFAPEAVIDPDAFFDEFGPLCTPPKANADELLMIATAVND